MSKHDDLKMKMDVMKTYFSSPTTIDGKNKKIKTKNIWKRIILHQQQILKKKNQYCKKKIFQQNEQALQPCKMHDLSSSLGRESPGMGKSLLTSSRTKPMKGATELRNLAGIG